HAVRRERTLFVIALCGIALYFIWPALRFAVYGFGHFVFRFSSLWISTLLLVVGLLGLQRALVSGWWRKGVTLSVIVVLIVMVAVMVFHTREINFDHFVRVTAFLLLYAGIALFAVDVAEKTQAAAFTLTAVCACELLVFAIPAVIDRDAVDIHGASS